MRIIHWAATLGMGAMLREEPAPARDAAADLLADDAPATTSRHGRALTGPLAFPG